jgi:mannose-1-phosphate guanylyltransferase / phosphomannomutase
MLKRAVLSGLVSTGVGASDLRLAPPALNRHEIRREARAGGIHVQVSEHDPEMVEILFFGPAGTVAGDADVKAIERLFHRQEFRRASHAEIGDVVYPPRAHETYVQDLLAAVDADAVRARALRLVVDYGRSQAAGVTRTLLTALGVEAVSAGDAIRPQPPSGDGAGTLGATGRLVRAVGADVGVRMDATAERITLLDERGEAIEPATALLLFLRELAGSAGDGALLVTVTESRAAEEVVEGRARLERTKAAHGDLLAAAARGDVVFAGASAGGYVFPPFLPAFDAVMSLAKALEVVARAGRPLSELVADLPRGALVHHRAPCPWSAKGAAMRLLGEAVKGKDVDHLDGIRVREDGGWVQVLPDPDEPVVHIFAEGEDARASERLQRRYQDLLAGIVAAQPPEA